jgi:2-dehydro-3-deoxyphosphogluconate aldolase / (4S)-4-hydroxy-2-oxoglutarate aldolase
MKKAEVLQKIESEKIIPVIRTDSETEAEKIVSAIFDGGIRIFEITLSVPNASQVIARLNEKFGEQILLGAGTVLDKNQAEKCVGNGAKFIVSPILDTEIVQFCREHEIAVFPAGLTPGEISKAHQTGADAVKVFPADSMGGAKYVKSLKAVFPQINLMPTGGVNLDTAKEFIKAGLYAVGIGADLADAQAIRAGNKRIITERAKQFVQIVKDSRK